ncbi:RNA polymerase ECF-type sigma factor [Aquipluma nitroreducens]|uniref:RNA polymerase ECF-type sigma factor n=1 Tax=Aquipluma nitroreducens TaxID=2010828 RepID=A0A5K7SDD7_9BACT|nr:sigma-70 family RNA polymerase sigma factor [Aquipluma nitroreducens]BBE19590.1 RNA polymerase ECF-type sigma factor [Aquipluma nitroreducens]
MIRDRSQWLGVWKRFRSGDRYAFSEIYEEFADVLFAYGSKITSDRELLKDCIQDLFYNLYRYNIQLHNPENLEFYLFRSLKNDIIRKIRKNYHEASLTDEGMLLFDLKFQAEQDIHDIESNELRVNALRKILQTIDPQKRELLFLKFSTGLNYSEIGELVGMTSDAVKKQVYRTLDNLRDQFGEQLLSLLMISVRR